MRVRAQRTEIIVVALLLAALLAKFFWPLVHFGVPLGYDAGIYRFLFLRHTEGFPPFAIADVPPWARGHPLGLFFFSTILLKLGVPVDWLIGFLWNLFPVLLALTLAAVIARRHGRTIGILVLLAAFLSPVFYDGFAAMYWKTFLSLLFCVLTYDALEDKKWLPAAIFGVLTVASHHQTGLLFGLVLSSWYIVRMMRGEVRSREFRIVTLVGLVILGIGLLTYLPIWREAVSENMSALLSRPGASASGNFPPLSFYLRTSGLLLAVGVFGFFLSWKTEKGSLWQLSVLWCVLFVFLQLLFYRRFVLQLDFFLLPFAARGMQDLWKHLRQPIVRMCLLILALFQAYLSLSILPMRVPIVDAVTFAGIRRMESIPRDTAVIDPENNSAVMLRGWLPHTRLIAPGLFDSPWVYDQWQRFLLGSHDDRRMLLGSLNPPIVLFIAPYFHSFYGDRADAFLADPCFHASEDPLIVTITCP